MKFNGKLLGHYIANFVIALVFLALSISNFSLISNYVTLPKLLDFFAHDFFGVFNYKIIDHYAVFGVAILWAVFFVATLMVIIFNKRFKNIPHLILALLMGVVVVISGSILVLFGRGVAAEAGLGNDYQSIVFLLIALFQMDPASATNLLFPLICIFFSFIYPTIFLFIADLVLFFKSIFGKTKDDEEDEDEDDEEYEDEDEDEDEEDKKSKKKDKNTKPTFYNGVDFINAFTYYYNYSPKSVVSDEDIQKFIDRAKQDTIIIDSPDDIPSFKDSKKNKLSEEKKSVPAAKEEKASEEPVKEESKNEKENKPEVVESTVVDDSSDE